ncbi:unnamed protein product, partial [Cuscuta epithymum]
MEEVMYQYKRMALGEENTNLNFEDEKDGKIVSIEKRAEFLVMGVVLTDRKEATVLPDRPPPPPPPPPTEPPPWSTGEARVWKHPFIFIVCLCFTFHDQTAYFSVDYLYHCKTFALGVGDESSAVTIIGSIMPNLGSASYIV